MSAALTASLSCGINPFPTSRINDPPNLAEVPIATKKQMRVLQVPIVATNFAPKLGR